MNPPDRMVAAIEPVNRNGNERQWKNYVNCHEFHMKYNFQMNVPAVSSKEGRRSLFSFFQINLRHFTFSNGFWLDLTWLDMFDVDVCFYCVFSISHFFPSLRNAHGRKGRLRLQLFVFRFACKKDVYHALANIERNDFCSYSDIRSCVLRITTDNNKKKFNTFSFSYSLPFPVCHRTKCFERVDVMSHYTRSVMYGNDESEAEEKRNHMNNNNPKCEMNSCIIHFCVDGVCVCIFISYLLCI